MQVIDEYCRIHYACRDRAAALSFLSRCRQGGLFLRVGRAALVPVTITTPVEVLSDVGCSVFLQKSAPEASGELKSELEALERRLSELRQSCFPQTYFTAQMITDIVRTNAGTLDLARAIPADVRVSQSGGEPVSPGGRASSAEGDHPQHYPSLEAEEARNLRQRPPRHREPRSRFAKAWEEKLWPGPSNLPSGAPENAPGSQ